jgi:hypothetical protein
VDHAEIRSDALRNRSETVALVSLLQKKILQMMQLSCYTSAEQDRANNKFYDLRVTSSYITAHVPGEISELMMYRVAARFSKNASTSENSAERPPVNNDRGQ